MLPLNMTDEAMEKTTLEVLDYTTYFGVDIDRDYNHSRGPHKMVVKSTASKDHIACIP